MDTQLVELAGRNWLTNELLRAGLEVARPERDRGIDLIAYKDINGFYAVPIQMKAAFNEVFSIFPKYEKFPSLLLVYVWNVGDSTKTKCFALTYEEALQVAGEMGYTKTDSWITGGKNNNRGYTANAPSKRLKEKLARYEMDNPKKWLELADRLSKKGELDTSIII